MASASNGGKGKGKAPPPPAKGKGKDRVFTLDTVAPNLSRTAMLCPNGDTIEAMAMSGKVLFTFPAVMDHSIQVHVLKRKIEHLIKGNAFKARVQLLRDGIPMGDDVVISDLSDVILKWSTGWQKVCTEDEVAFESQRHIATDKSMDVQGFSFQDCREMQPVDAQGLSFQDCREQVVQLLELSWEKLQRKFAEDTREWEEKVAAWHQEKVKWGEEEERREKLRAEAEAKGMPKGKGKGKGKGKMRRRPEPPLKPEPPPPAPAKIVTGFQVPKGIPGRSWPMPEMDGKTNYRRIGGVALPIETDVPDFLEARQLYVDWFISKRCPDYAEWKARESTDPQCAEYCEKVREALAIRHISPARPKEGLRVPWQLKPVDIFETIRKHFCSTHNSSSRIDDEIPLPVFGFCVNANLPASDLCSLLEAIKIGDEVGVLHNSCVGSQFRSEVERLGIHLEDVLQHLEVRVLDESGSLSHPVYPPQHLDYVDPRVFVDDVTVTFVVSPYGLPRSSNSAPSASDLCIVAINPRSYNEHKRLALEALAIKALDSGLSTNAKKGLVTIGCLLSTHSDAAVREQAQELLFATATLENLNFVKIFFSRHSCQLGERIVQDLCLQARMVQQ